MKKIFYIGLMTIGLVACSTVGQAPLDDAYYWEKTTSVPSAPSQPSTYSQQTTPAPAPAPKQTVEYTNVQDTTVTIRIHK